LSGSSKHFDKRIAARQGNAIRLGRIPETIYACEMIVPMRCSELMSISGLISGVTNVEPSK
jgi:hypothetical protein